MLTITADTPPHPSAAKRAVCNSAALHGLAAVHKAAAGLRKISPSNNLQDAHRKLLSITSVVIQPVVLVTTL
jgi:hypothetical protein